MPMEYIKISFIVPVYNCEKYLEECLGSLINQTIDSKEIILVNDGSTDDSLKICKEYAKKYDFIKVVNQENQGLSVARNEGVKICLGKYIQFVDSDDFIEAEAGEKFYNLCEFYNLDMIRGKYHLYYENEGQTITTNNFSKFKYLDMPIKSRDYFIECFNFGVYEVTAILGLFKKTFYLKNSLMFVPGITMEDHEFTLKALTFDSSAMIMQTDYDFYTYRKRKNSITTTPNINKISDILIGFNLILEFINKHNFNKELKLCCDKAASALVYQATSIYGRLSESDRENAKEIFPKDVLDFCIKNSITIHHKIKFFLLRYFRCGFNYIYRIKLR